MRIFSYSKIVRVSKNSNSVKITLFFLTAEVLHAGAEVGESAGGSHKDGVTLRVRSCRGNVRRARVNSRHISANPCWNREGRAQKIGHKISELVVVHSNEK